MGGNKKEDEDKNKKLKVKKEDKNKVEKKKKEDKKEKLKVKNDDHKSKNDDHNDSNKASSSKQKSLLEKLASAFEKALPIIETILPIVKTVVEKFFTKALTSTASQPVEVQTTDTTTAIASDKSAVEAVTKVIGSLVPALVKSSPDAAQPISALDQKSIESVFANLPKVLAGYKIEELVSIFNSVNGKLAKAVEKSTATDAIVNPNAVIDVDTSGAKPMAKVVANNDIIMNANVRVDAPMPADEHHDDASLAGAVADLHVDQDASHA